MKDRVTPFSLVFLGIHFCLQVSLYSPKRPTRLNLAPDLVKCKDFFCFTWGLLFSWQDLAYLALFFSYIYVSLFFSSVVVELVVQCGVGDTTMVVALVVADNL